MLPTLREVLAMPAFREADVEVLTGDPDAVSVRWVHSSEVYEMGGLLSGGEVLLTTGLGLHGRSAAQLTAYVDQLADAGCVALALEIGRSFFEVPVEFVDAARRRGLVLVALGAIVPFERMVEDFHDLLIRRKVGSPRAGEPVWQELLGLVVAGQGMTSLLNAVSRLAGCEVEFVDTDGQVVERSRIVTGQGRGERTVAEVRGPTGPLGRLVLAARPTQRRTAVAERAAVAVALELGRHPDHGARPSLAHAVITDLANGLLTSEGDLVERLSAAGWVATDEHVLVAAVDVDGRTPVRDAVPVVQEAVQSVLGNCLVGSAGHHVIVLAHGWRHALPARVRASFAEAYDAMRVAETGQALRTLGVAAPVAEFADVAGAVAQARDVVQVARRFGTRSGVLLARDVGTQRLLGSVDSAALSSFITEQLGPLIAFDAQHSADLVRTLDAHLANGGSKTRTALALGIRRQSLYARLERIAKLLGADLDDPAQTTSLGLALTAWRMRTGLDPQAAFDRPH
ncbi:PucR family transcriptional regulator [Solicola gregarius]|uniref:PucR family transcriptional regulator ligand-binding domain-containing protein n=1 Tax=Solicola gregarius TaxID=2908642 RepID=A0AA46YJ75_9ACTN|nr:PucR family transcriptional regulator [Solicola gregarius]UYM04002.1 PucR family transcriptional regulator ligand-binding domain-containing protein [Solicola gregarius]